MLNKKTYIRLLALVMALMMTVAVFAGCNNQEAIDEANSKADAAQQAAEEAKKAADSLAQAAKDLADQLKNTQDENNALKDAISSVNDKADDAHDDISDYHDPSKVTTAKPVETTPSIPKDPWEKWTEEANLKAFTDLKNDYLIIKRDWYTPANYAALNKIFEDASFEIYRAVDGVGLEQIINDASTKAAAIDNIQTDAAAVQAKIAAFGDVATQVFTESDPLVTAAREAFDAWVNKYASCFFLKNGYSNFQYDDKGNIITAEVVYVKDAAGNKVQPEKVAFIIDADIVEFAKKVTSAAVGSNVLDINTNNLLYAEAKLEALYGAAKEAIIQAMKVQLHISGDYPLTETDKNGNTIYNDKLGGGDKGDKPNGFHDDIDTIVATLFDEEATQVQLTAAIKDYELVKAIIYKYKEEGQVSYDACKENGKLVEEAYDLYKIFTNANNNVDTPIAGAAGKDLLTGEQFVKLYVMTLYTGELREYQNDVKDYLYNKIVPFFLNKNNASVINTETNGWNKLLAVPANYNEDIYVELKGDNNGQEIITLKDGSYVTFAVDADAIYVYDAVTGAKTSKSVKADGVKIENAFNDVAARTAAKIFAVNFADDFKGMSLKEAYLEIDQYIVEAVAELAQTYYNQVVACYFEETLKAQDDALEAFYSYETPEEGVTAERIDAYYYAHDKAFYNNIHKLIKAAIDGANVFKVATYDELNTIADEEKDIKNIEDQTMFQVTWTDERVYLSDSVALYLGDNKDVDDDGVIDYQNSAMKTVLEYFAKYMKEVTTELYTKWENIEDAKEFYELKVDVAEKLDSITGIYKLNDTKVSEEPTKSLIIDNFGGKIATLQNKKLDDIKASIYKTIDAARIPGRDAIMAVEYINYDDGTLLFTTKTYQAQYKNSKKEIKDLYYNDKLEIKDSAKDNKAINIIVDKDVIAKDTLYNVFNESANAVLSAFAGIERARIQKQVTSAIELYKAKYDFGGLDHVDQQGVFLQADMEYYTQYLDELSTMEKNFSFDTHDFHLVDDLISDVNVKGDTLSFIENKGYVMQKVVDDKDNVVDYVFHIADFDDYKKYDANTGAVTADLLTENVTGVGATNASGWYNSLAYNELVRFFNLTTANAFDGLEQVRQLSYIKDSILNGTKVIEIDKNFDDVVDISVEAMPYVRAKYMATVDKTTGAVTADPTAMYKDKACVYEPNTLRTKQYLEEFEETYEVIRGMIEDINLVDVIKDEELMSPNGGFAYAVDDIADIVTNAQSETITYKTDDDVNLTMVYVRYYLIGEYDWLKYQNNTK